MTLDAQSPAADLAQALIAARNGGPAFAPATPGPARDAALAVQAATVAALGPVGGFKTGYANGARQNCSPILASLVAQSGATLARPASGRIGVELEMGFRVIGPLPDPATATPAEIAAAFAPVVVFEPVATRLGGEAADDAGWKLADLQVNQGLVIGTGPDSWDGAEFQEVTAFLQVGDTVVLDGPAKVPGPAVATLMGVVASIEGHCGGLRPGQVVITGTLNPIWWTEGGVTVSGRVEGFGAVEMTLA